MPTAPLDDADFNPYASPVEAPLVEAELSSAVWRHGNVLVMHRQAVLPPRCVKCNRPAEVSLKRRLSWCHPAWLLTLFCLGWLCILVILVVSRRAKIQVPMCRAHVVRRRWRIAGAWLSVIVAVGLLIGCAGVADSRGANASTVAGILGLTAIGCFFAAVIFGWMARLVTAVRIDKQYIRLKHVCPEYLATLPETSM